MAKRLQEYETDEIVVTFAPDVCIHSGICLRGLPDVFDVRRRRWVAPEAAPAEAVAAQIRACPSGALGYRMKTARSAAPVDGGAGPIGTD